MAGNSVLLIVLSVLAMLYYYSQAQLFSSTLLLEKTSHCPPPISEKLTIFDKGKYGVSNPIKVKKFGYDSACEPLLILSPREAGSYPVLFFIHGTFLSNTDYSEFFTHIASHGYVVVAAPRLYFSTLRQFLKIDQTDEIEMAATVINWLHSNLTKHLNRGVKAELNKLAISGHSRGGKSAFALALGIPNTIKLSLKIAALIGVDPVAGLPFHNIRTTPCVLTNKSNSFDLSIPVTVIGTGKGSHRSPYTGTPPCAPPNVSHQEFFNECKDGSHFVIEEYGHMQMLDDSLHDRFAYWTSLFCYGGIGSKDVMRRTLGGIMVAFLDATMKDDIGQYCTLLAKPSFLVPTNVSVETKGNHFGFAPTYYAQV